MAMEKATFAILIILFVSNLGVKVGCTKTPAKREIDVESHSLDNKKARNIISSFLNAWKTSNIIPEHRRNSKIKMRSPSRQMNRNHPPFRIDKLDFLGQRKSHLDAPSLFALRSAFNPKPIKRHQSRQKKPEAETYFGKDADEEETSPELKLASLVSKPIYHNLPVGDEPSTEENIRQYMFGNRDDQHADNFGLSSENWVSSPNMRRSFARVPGEKTDEYVEDYTQQNENKRNDVVRANDLDIALRMLRDEIPAQEKQLIEEQKLRNMLLRNSEKKELITDPYDGLSLPVSEFFNGQDVDRKFYKSSPDTLFGEYGNSPPSEFKLQKDPLWGNIQKRWRRSKLNRVQHYPRLQPNLQENGVERSLAGELGETGNTFDAYGQIGQDAGQIGQYAGQPPSYLKFKGNKLNKPCNENSNQEIKTDQFSPYNQENSPLMYLNGAARIQQDPSKQDDGRIIQLSPDGIQKRLDIGRPYYNTLARKTLRNKRSTLMLKRKTFQDALARKLKAATDSKFTTDKNKSSAKSRSLSGNYLGGLPDSRGIENGDGITEDNEHASLEEKLAHDSTPFLMRISQRDRDDMNKFWNNKHSPGNGFYTGHGEGPNHPYLGDYFGHGPDEMLHEDGIKSLEESAAPEDHHTANIIDSIWEHDLGDDHLSEHHLEGHHGGLKIKNYFGGHHSPNIMLPTETLDGIDTQWPGHVHSRISEYTHNEGHPVDFSATKIKAIQAIQDDPSIDAELNPHDGIGMEFTHGHHRHHDYHHGGMHSYGDMNLAPVVGEPVRIEDSKEDEYKQHIDNLLSQYHGLEERLKGTGGTLEGHMNPESFAHHGSHHLHSGYDLYAYKNPWENMKIPYHVPVINHPYMEEEPSPPSPLNFGGKTDEKGGPVIEGGKEEGGKGGPLVEESKALNEKGTKGKDGETGKGAKELGEKGPMPVIPKQRGGPELSTGKVDAEEPAKEKEAKEPKDNEKNTESKEENKGKEKAEHAKQNKPKQTEQDKTNDKEVKTEAKGNKNTSKENHAETEGSEAKDTANEKEASSEKDEHASNEDNRKNLTSLVEYMMNNTGKQSEMINNLKTALGDEANNPKSVASLQLAKLQQLGSMQKALLSSLVKQAVSNPKDSQMQSNKEDDLKQLFELQKLQQLGAGIKANSIVNTLKQNSLLQSLKAAQENILKGFKEHASLVEEKQDLTATQTPEFQKFFGKIPIKLFGSDFGNVGSEKMAVRSHSLPNAEIASNIGNLLHSMNNAHIKKPGTSTRDGTLKPTLSNLLAESLLKTMKNKLRHSSRENQSNNKDSQTDKAYSTIGNEGPTTGAEEETGRTRSTHSKGKKTRKLVPKYEHKKLLDDRELNDPEIESSEVAAFHQQDFEEEVSKKDSIKPKKIR